MLYNSTPLTVAVAMCTYNGERFLQEQLDSIAQQSRPPDEMIVCDDCSTDGTLQILQQFADSVPFRVVIDADNIHRGTTQNFARVIGLCTADVIFLSDQDDFWLSEKIERYIYIFGRKPDVCLVASDSVIVNDRLVGDGSTVWRNFNFRKRTVKSINRSHPGGAFRSLLRQCPVGGHSLAFRRHCRDVFLPIPANWTSHDLYLVKVVAGFGAIRLLAEPMTLYRRHGTETGQASQGSHGRELDLLANQTVPRDHYLREAERNEAVTASLEHITSLCNLPGLQDAIKFSAGKTRFLQARHCARSRGIGRLLCVAGLLLRGEYHKFGRGWFSFVRDVLG